MEKKYINVLVVDDSPIVRDVLSGILNSDSQLNVIATAGDPYQAAKVIKKIVPDVITLDIEMPRMDGLTFLKKIMSQRPIPVVIISSLTKKGADATFKAIEYGAVEVIEKPKMGTEELIEEAKIIICDKVKAASITKLKKQFKPLIVKPKFSTDVILPLPKTRKLSLTNQKIIAVGASTGGTEAIKDFLMEMPTNSPGIVIVQHMPEVFTKSFADRLNQMCRIRVQEAVNGQQVEKGLALIAPGDKHMIIKQTENGYFVQILTGKLVNRHRPSVDVLFRSVAISAGSNATAVILTGMGDDGAKGIAEIKEYGGFTIAQDEATSVVYGMPKEAAKHDKSIVILPLNKIATIVKQKLFIVSLK